MQQQEIESDLAHATDLFGAVGIGAGSGGTQRTKPIAIVDPKDPTRSINLADMDIFRPTTKAQFDQLRETLVPLLTANKSKGNYVMFLQEFTRALVKDLESEKIRTISSKMTTLANEKQKEEKEAQKSGKKKGKGKVGLAAASAKVVDAKDTTNYDDAAYDDL